MPKIPAQEHLQRKLLGRIPFVVGVVGHRDLRPEDRAALKAKVSEVFARLKTDYLPDESDTPLVLLSALAEGADRLVADVALEHGAILIAPLPMEEDAYREDFRGKRAIEPNAEQEFDRLLNAAFAKHALRYRDGSSRDIVRADAEKREQQYQDVGIYIVNHCHVLIALWNGDETDMRTGGTTEVMSFKRLGVPMALAGSMRSALDGSEIGPVIHVVTPRAKHGSRQVDISVEPWGMEVTGRPRALRGSAAVALLFVRNLLGLAHHEEAEEKRGWRVFNATVRQTRQFNMEAAKFSERGPEGIDPAQSLIWLFEDTSKRQRPGAESQAKLAAPYWCELYQLADAAAQARQRNFKLDWRTLFVAGLAAIMVFETYAHLLPNAGPLLLLYAVIFGGIFWWFYHARKAEHQERFLDYRALAEALRVAVYWKLAGIQTPIGHEYPIKQPSELAWVRIVLRTYDMLHQVDGSAVKVEPDDKPLMLVRDLWVDGQRAYFKRQGDEHHRVAEMREAQSLALLALSPIIGLVLWVLLERHVVGEVWHHLFLVSMGLVAGLAAVIAGYVEKLAHNAHARQYDRMRMVFEHALRLIDDKRIAAPPSDRAALYVELGREAMKENAEWVAIYRQRPIRPAG